MARAAASARSAAEAAQPDEQGDTSTYASEESIAPEDGPLRALGRMLARRKTLKAILQESMQDQDAGGSKLTLFDLLCIGIGSTIGSGVFVLTGKALPEAGPSAVISWLLAGLICLLSSSAYMELSARLPTKGSCYVFGYHGLGELAGVIGSVCLTMEYGISGAGVARNWSAKLSQLARTRLVYCYNGAEWGDGCDDDDDYYFDPLAAAITAMCTIVVMLGMNMGKVVINAFTIMKLLLVAFLIVGGLACWQGNMFESAEAFAPRGAGGTVSATSLLFFGFIGFDEVCCMASKANNPSKTMPRALAGTLFGAAVFSGLAQFSLSAMVPYVPGMKSVPFEEAFYHLGLHWARWLVALGELVLLPLVVLLSILPQPEVTAAMSEDGLIPAIFHKQNKEGVYVQGTFIIGVALTLVAFAVPFNVLWDIVSLGVLFGFNLTSAALINVRYGNGGTLREPIVDSLTWILMACMGVAGYTIQLGVSKPLLNGGTFSTPALLVGSLALVIALAVMFTIRFAFDMKCDMSDDKIFKAFGVPFIPGAAMFFNFFLIADLPVKDIGYFSVFVVVFVLVYFFYTTRKELLNRKKDGNSSDASEF